MYYIYKGEYLYEKIETLTQLILFYKKHNNYWNRTEDIFSQNEMLALTKMHPFDNYQYPLSEKELKECYSVEWIKRDKKRKYSILDDEGNFFNIWKYQEEILGETTKEQSFEYGHLYTSKYYHRSKNEIYKFRVDPVPGVKNYNGGPYQRNAKHIQEKRKLFACEDKELIRGKRRLRQLHDPWDETNIRVNERSWKTQSKEKRQSGYDQKKIREFKRQSMNDWEEE